MENMKVIGSMDGMTTTVSENSADDILKNTHIVIPVQNKVALTISEAAAYSNIGQNRISNLLRTPNCPFALFVGNKKLVKRREFEKFLESRLTV
ncbi:excisionase [Butyrivibrio sp. NC2002]|uniref:excisionase n=1 Tax=Butyrivibrio sp. NC2002 TaxID=1410610 RepID=UPI002E8E0AAB|nr:excisionase [Butyrivibrio sp. NC2002]